ncbi:MAG TPA: glycosyl hydrolase [Thermoanaerobaculia bacterium]|jgi:hypothetical protein|nr:glycosyl hydrolase [Thermoanaerobaculia bacterium]
MKIQARAVLVALLWAMSFSAARADGPVTIGVNGSDQLARDANISWVRTGSYWAEINPSPGVWDFSIAESRVQGALDRGQQVLFILSGAPAWCGGGSNGATACDIELWKSFVDQVTLHFQGRIAAYEVWNEPDLSGQGAFGVGWDRSLTSYPAYIDYFVEAARIIRRNAPGTLVVGPAMSKSTSRSVTIWEQFDQTNYPDGNASDFVDVVSFHHATTRGDAHSEDVAWDIHDRITNIIRRFNPRNGYKPMWVTEFGWKVAGTNITESTQRVRIKNLLIEMGGGGDGILSGFNIPKAFIYVLKTCDGDEGYGIYRCDNTPRPVVSTYLWTKPFPATQSPSEPRE